MPYASGRRFLDADSHLMELPDFLRDHAESSMRDRLPPLGIPAGGRMQEALDGLAEQGGLPPERVDELIALGDELIAGPKGYEALGACSSSERTAALDQLGFERQFVFSTFAAGAVFRPDLEPDVARAATAAHNRAMAAFCEGDDRLIGVAAIPLDDPDAAVAEISHVVDLGLGAAWVPHRLAGGASPGHDRLDRFWAALAEAGLPALLHVGGVNLQVEPGWMDTGRPVPTDWLGGGENVRGKDMIALHQSAELFVGAMVLDGVLERHRDLRIGVIELGAGWVPAMVRRLDQIAAIWQRSEPELAALTRPPSQQLAEQAGFTPYPFEDVGALIRESDPHLYLFSSDYPHVEGGRHPLGRFESSLAGVDDVAKDLFYADNMARLLREPAVA
ncbi:MAG: amidohydrolase family protein [Acidimicrobiia bacterium]